ncbi:MAG: hypothetical protein ACLS4R_13920, partial [Roseburia inulinivorans]
NITVIKFPKICEISTGIYVPGGNGSGRKMHETLYHKQKRGMISSINVAFSIKIKYNINY